MTLKKLTLATMTVLLAWLFITSITNINIFGFTMSTKEFDTQENCIISSNSCEDATLIVENNSDLTTQTLAYVMIIIGISLLVINWRISRLENN